MLGDGHPLVDGGACAKSGYPDNLAGGGAGGCEGGRRHSAGSHRPTCGSGNTGVRHRGIVDHTRNQIFTVGQ